MKQEDAKKILGDVQQDHCFYINDGQRLKNLNELYTALAGMDNATFSRHVNSEKNDFSNWIRDVIGDRKLAEKLSKAKTARKTINTVKQRLQYLNRAVS
jgi:hypothetical protein